MPGVVGWMLMLAILVDDYSRIGCVPSSGAGFQVDIAIHNGMG
jgi:hypothetical protein